MQLDQCMPLIENEILNIAPNKAVFTFLRVLVLCLVQVT